MRDSIKDLEGQLIEALYEQRLIESKILEYDRKSRVPQDLVEELCAARVRFNGIERKIRLVRYGF